MQTFFTAEASSVQLPHVFEPIARAITDDNEMVKYVTGLHPRSHLIAAMQLEAYGRSAACDSVVSIVHGRPTTLPDELRTYVLQHRENPTSAFDYGRFGKPRQLDRDYFTPEYQKRVSVAYPAQMVRREWEDLARRTHGVITRAVQEKVAETGDGHPESEIMRAGLRLVCAKKMIPSQLPFATAPTRVRTAHAVLKNAKTLYSRGVVSMSGALSRGGFMHEWDELQELSATCKDHRLKKTEQAMILEDGLAIAIRFKDPRVALQLASDSLALHMKKGRYSPSGEPSARLIHGLAVVVQDALETKK